MNGSEIKKELRKNFKKLLDKIDDNIDYKFEVIDDVFDGCNLTYTIKKATPDDIQDILKIYGNWTRFQKDKIILERNF